MIRDAEVLDEGFVPNDLQHRDAELTHLESVLRPFADGAPGQSVIITGPTGAGKTVTAKYVIEQLTDAAPAVQSIHLNCWRSHTQFRAFYRILDELELATDIHRGSTPHDELISRLEAYDGNPVVVVLDEADQLDSTDIFYDLHSLPKFAQLIVANDRDQLFGRLNSRLQSRLQSGEHVTMSRYPPDELVSILSVRVRWGLETGAVSQDILERIADAAAGDARVALGMLRRAANYAVREHRDEITFEVLEAAMPDARAQIRQRNVDALNDHQRAVLDTVRAYGPLSPQEIYDHYEQQMDDPNQLRTVKSYLSKLTEYRLIDAEGSTRDRVYRPVQST
ncbi:Cdc6/Cdc18 family protein [Haloferax sp. ATB1]|uniref:Cdc6/Cdc18 family protein n=1 Tax=Haloferax sp. ATB1 TaxID=1508454 RepID=UPI0005B22274|nr:Cdc6/Cdc18 family protein [Haloferax sp. ATB1]